MDFSLKNRVALVTGGSRGIGKTIALSLAKEGADIILCGRGSEALEKTRAEVEKLGVKAYAKSLDATKPNEVGELFSEIVERIGGLDILVNNIGGVTRFGAFEDLETKDWIETMELNFMSMVHFSKEALPWLKKSKHARIINISTIPARQPGFFNPHYNAAKAAMLNLSKYLANNFAKDGVLVNSICPSTIRGENWNERVADRAKRDGINTEEAEAKMVAEETKKVPLGTLGEPEDIASVVVFLSSDKARFITGTSIDVDGGVSRAV